MGNREGQLPEQPFATSAGAARSGGGRGEIDGVAERAAALSGAGVAAAGDGVTERKMDSAGDGVTLRQLASTADLQACFDLQLLIWGADFREGVSPSMLKISQYVGGVAAGAFARDGCMLGFVYGLTGVRPPGGGRLLPEPPPLAATPPPRPPSPSPLARQPAAAEANAAAGSAAAVAAPPAARRTAVVAVPELMHWSHMLAVLPEARDLRLGTRLKLYQRELLLPLGVRDMEWTFDPLEARNAHLNLNLLGARVIEYVEDMYGDDKGSQLAAVIGTDRFIVRWDLHAELAGAGAAALAAAFAAAPAVSVAADGEAPPPPAGPRVRIEVPPRIQDLKGHDPERALAWRLATRRAFQSYLAGGYRVAGFYRDPSGSCFYALERMA